MKALRRPWLWVPLLLALVVGTAVIGGYTLVPDVVRSQGGKWVDTNLPGKQLTMGDIRFDPWKLLLTPDADGGLTIWLQHDSPGPDRESNWLPTPAGPFFFVARLYGPKAEALDGRWRLPPLVKTD